MNMQVIYFHIHSWILDLTLITKLSTIIRFNQYSFLNPGITAMSILTETSILLTFFDYITYLIEHYTSNNGKSQIFVNQYAASTLDWNQIGVQITQTTNYPLNSDGSATSIRIDKTNDNFILSLRVPWCTKNTGAYVNINGNTISQSRIVPKSYLNFGLNDDISFKVGDVIDVKIYNVWWMAKCWCIYVWSNFIDRMNQFNVF